jgi:glycerate kinase
MLEWLDFDRALHGADLVITGEGSLDDQSLAGKAPVGVAKAAAQARVTTVAVAGRSLLSDERLR